MASGSWVFIVPVDALYLTEDVGREFRVDRVIFVHRDRLPRVRKRLGLGKRVSELKNAPWVKEFFERAPALAVVRGSGKQEEVEQQCLALVREELSLLALSQLGYSRRKDMAPVMPAGEGSRASMRYMVARSQDMTGRLMWRRTTPTAQMRLDGRWKSHQDHHFFTELLKILRRETKVQENWRKELRRATVMIGESVGANDLFKSFLWNMVALEMLLTQNEKGEMIDILPKRIGALIDWTASWHADNYEDRIRDVYKKRNMLLHRGRREDLSVGDVAFTDHLLVNVLMNFVSAPKVFSSKDAVVKFAERLEAERLLRASPKQRPTNLRFMRPVKPDF
jgi:hypothetical protein